MDMQGKSVLVTGAASGIGRRTALRYAERGAARIACLDIHEAGNRETARMIADTGAAAFPIAVDLGDVARIRAAFAEASGVLGRLDAAALIGGFSWRGETLDVTEAEWDAVIGVNLRGTFFCCQAALRIMYGERAGAIVAMSADAAFFPIEGFAVQAAAKGGVAQMIRTLALEAARRGVRINAVSPGIVDVTRTGNIRPPARPLRRAPDALPLPPASSLDEQTAAGRFMTELEVADAILFLSSEAGAGVSGTVLFVNGGGYFSLRYE